MTTRLRTIRQILFTQMEEVAVQGLAGLGYIAK
jgi:hypothetical protein